MKAVVYIALTFEVAQTLMVTRDSHLIFSEGYGDLVGLNDLHLLWLTLPIFGGISTFFCLSKTPFPPKPFYSGPTVPFNIRISNLPFIRIENRRRRDRRGKLTDHVTLWRLAFLFSLTALFLERFPSLSSQSVLLSLPLSSVGSCILQAFYPR